MIATPRKLVDDLRDRPILCMTIIVETYRQDAIENISVIDDSTYVENIKLMKKVVKER